MCCNKQRQQYQALIERDNQNLYGTPSSSGAHSPAMNSMPARLTAVYFEYTGKTGLTIVSPASGKHYRFDRPGARLEVDPGDTSWMAFVPNVKRVG